VLASAAGVLTAFLYFYTRSPASLVSWTISQQAFNSSMLLLLDALETGNFGHVRKIEHAYIVFRELQDNGVHTLAPLAVEKLSWGLDQLRKTVVEEGTQRPLEKTDTTSTAFNEIPRVGKGSGDTVMGNTGMMLLEEQGLQSYTTECFTPFTYAETEAASEAAIPSQSKQEQDPKFYGSFNSMAGMKLDRSITTVPVSKELQGGAESPPRSASRRYCAPPSHEHFQPHSSATGPASPRSLAAPVPQQNRNEATIVSDHHRQQRRQSPHSRHPKSRRTTPLLVNPHDQRPDSGTGGSGSAAITQAWYQLASTPENDQSPAAQCRHNSCPALHEFATTPPLLRPTYSSPLANNSHSPVRDERYDMHIQWSANPAAPMLDSSDPGMVISPVTKQGHVGPDFCHRGAQQQHSMYHYPFPNHSLITSAAENTAMNAEQMTVEQWKRWVGSGAHE
jgi:hypothetical protein